MGDGRGREERLGVGKRGARESEGPRWLSVLDRRRANRRD